MTFDPGGFNQSKADELAVEASQTTPLGGA